jgi:lipoprotein-anchoring transpeptidase ErfK/SrfK
MARHQPWAAAIACAVKVNTPIASASAPGQANLLNDKTDLSLEGLSVMIRVFRLLVLVAATALMTVQLSAPLRAGEAVAFSGQGTAGTVVVRTNERRLYYVTAEGRAIRYTVGVGRADKQWFGTTSVASKHIRPAWSPPAEIRRGGPNYVIESGSPRNPMGAAALVLADNELAIHGTNNPGSVGGFVSWGCIRMHNKDIMDLYDRVSVGTRVVFTH